MSARGTDKTTSTAAPRGRRFRRAGLGALAGVLAFLGLAAAAEARTYTVTYDASQAEIVVTAPNDGTRDHLSVFRIDGQSSHVWTHSSADTFTIQGAAALVCADGRFSPGAGNFGAGFLNCTDPSRAYGMRVVTQGGDDQIDLGYTNVVLPEAMRVVTEDGPGSDVIPSYMTAATQPEFETYPTRIIGGTGNDGYAMYGYTQFQVTYAARSAAVDATATGVGSAIVSGNGETAIGESDAYSGVYSVEGGTAGDQLTTLAPSAVLRGNGGPDRLSEAAGGFHKLFGDGGDDQLVAAGPGTSASTQGHTRDEVQGGAGIDTVDYSYATASVRLEPGTTTNGVSGESALLGADVENLTGGDGADFLLGDNNENAIDANKGNDFIRAAGGDDLVDAVDSRLFVDDVGCGTGGQDRVRADYGFDIINADCENRIAPPDDDQDGCSDADETDVFGTNPNDPDSDDDGIGDCVEATDSGCLNPLDSDSDNDGVLDGQDAFPCDPTRTAPNTTATGPSGLMNTTTPSYTLSSDDPAATFQCRVDGASFTSCTSTYTPTLTEGPHTIEMRAVSATVPNPTPDPTPATKSVTVDVTPPDVPGLTGPNGATADTTPEWQLTGEPGASFFCKLDTGAFEPCGSTYSPGPFAEGSSHVIQFRQRDAAGNDGAAVTRSVTIDTVAPGAPTVTGPSGPTATANPEWTIDGEGGATFLCKVDGGAFQVCGSPFSPGPFADGSSHTIVFKQRDAANNESPTVTRTISVDTSAPAAPAIGGGPANGSHTSDSTPTFTFTTEAGSTTTCAVDGGSYAPCSSGYSPSLTDGEHTITIRSSDAAGNQSETSRTFTVDTVAPSVAITSGPSGQVSVATAAFGFSSNEDPNVTYACQMDGGGFAACSSPSSYAGLSEGSHTFAVRGTDRAGNTDTETRAFQVKTTPDTPPGGPNITVNTGIPTLADCDNRIAGSKGRDRMLGTTGQDRLLGRAGNDLVMGQAGRDCLLGNTGNDKLVGGPEADRIVGGPGDDVIKARDGVRDLVKCGAGRADRVIADAIDLVSACEKRKIG